MTNLDVYTQQEADNVVWSDTSHAAGRTDRADRSNKPAFDISEERVLHSWAMMQLYGSKLTQTTADHRQSVQIKTLPERLSAILVELGEKHGGLIPNLRQSALADRLGTQRETVAALLRSFQRQGLIRISYRRIEIANAAGLNELAY